MMNFFDGLDVGIDLVKIDRFKKIPFDENKSFYT
jgi:phosphopantetheinyl transferase (holo-ACP synthase)